MSTSMTTAENNKQDVKQQSSRPNGRNDEQYRPVFSPRFDIWEGSDELILYGDLPGVEPDSLDIKFENRQLTILGKVCRGHDQHKSLYAEYEVGDFERTFTIGEAINGEGINAKLRDGVLTLHLPKSDSAKPRRIQVKAD